MKHILITTVIVALPSNVLNQHRNWSGVASNSPVPVPPEAIIYYTVKPATSASLVYVVPDWGFSRSIGERWREESRRSGTTVAPLIEQKNRLAWLVKATYLEMNIKDKKGKRGDEHSEPEVWVDALNGDVIGGRSVLELK